MMPNQTKSELRKTILAQRTLLSLQEVKCLSKKIFHNFKHSPYFNRVFENIALYAACKNEVDFQTFYPFFWEKYNYFYLPVIKRYKPPQMAFYSAYQNTPFKLNQWNILEPDIAQGGHMITPEQIDLVLVPLVAFSESGYRIGMGAGFYDACFSFKHAGTIKIQKPILVGLAYEFQKIPEFMHDPWDLKLDAVVTENKIYIF